MRHCKGCGLYQWTFVGGVCTACARKGWKPFPRSLRRRRRPVCTTPPAPVEQVKGPRCGDCELWPCVCTDEYAADNAADAWAQALTGRELA